MRQQVCRKQMGSCRRPENGYESTIPRHKHYAGIYGQESVCKTCKIIFPLYLAFVWLVCYFCSEQHSSGLLEASSKKEKEGQRSRQRGPWELQKWSFSELSSNSWTFWRCFFLGSHEAEGFGAEACLTHWATRQEVAVISSAAKGPRWPGGQRDRFVCTLHSWCEV